MTNEIKKQENIQPRPPIVVVLGHVDHGKSSILEAIKDLKITSKESGGITQHIGAYQVEHEGKKITLIDTPGHEAFSAMRSRGAKIADIAILVVAAEESIKPQTKEAIEHIKKAGIPMIVALNKIDKPQADQERVKRELIAQDVIVESMGGENPCVGTSATTGKGIKELLEMIILVSEMEELKADISKKPRGFIIESYLTPKRGPVATVIVQEGILEEGAVIATESTIGKIKSMEDFEGNAIKKGLPAQPVLILGFEQSPVIGEEFKSFDNIEEAKKQATQSNKKIFEGVKKKDGQKVLNLILKADVSGSLEAIENVLKNIPQDKAIINILKAGAGEINDSDIKMAKASNSMIFGFRTKANQIAQKLALKERVRIITFDIIYELAQAVRTLLEKQLSPEIVKDELGKIKVLAIFRTEKNRQIIGGKITDGEARRGALLRVYRDEEPIGKGKIIKLQKEKEEVDSLEKGRECGVLFQGDIELKEDDILEIYTEKKQKSTL